jgi:hypothetical protein
MSIQQALQKELQDSKRWFEIEKDDSTYKGVIPIHWMLCV